MIRFKYLITGCGRSGTKYIASIARKLGVQIGHESFGLDGIASWQLAFNDVQAPYIQPRCGVAFDIVLHQVRHPLLVIPSLSTFKAESWKYIARHVDCRPDEPLLLRAAKYWVHWNEHAHHLAQWTYRIENLPAVFEEFCQRIGARVDPAVLASTSTFINTRRGRPWLSVLRPGLDRLNRSQMLDQLYSRSRAYLDGKPLNWEMLEHHAPDWSHRVIELARAYGYTSADDAAVMDGELLAP